MPADPVSETAARAVVRQALCSTHGHATQDGGGHECTRRAIAVLAALTAAGWQLAPPGSVVVHLPEPQDVLPVCSHDPFVDGCTCGGPGIVWFDGGVTLDIGCGAIYDGTGRTFEPEAARLQAARVLSAAALWDVYREATPAPETGGRP